MRTMSNMNKSLSAMIGMVLVAFLLAFVTVGCGGSSPTEPTPYPTPTPNPTPTPGPSNLGIVPTSATIAAGTTHQFSANGGTGSYTWTATGGTLSAATGNFVTYTSGGVAGTFEVRVKSGTAEAVAVVTIPSLQNSLTFISADPPSGSTLNVGEFVNITVAYNAVQSGGITATLSGINGGSGGGSGPQFPAGSGTATARTTSKSVGTTTLATVDLVGPKLETIISIDIPLTYIWK